MWLVGMIVNFIATQQPTVHLMSMIGGVLLSIGLICAMIAVKMVGMAVMLVVAGGVTLLSGWLTNE